MLTLAAVQAEALPGEVERNVASAARWVRRAAEAGADVVLFPEAFVTGYDDQVFARALPRLDEDRWVAPLQAAVEETGAVVVLNTALSGAGAARLADVVLAPGERPVAAYAKQHLYASERHRFVAGEGGASLVVAERRLGLAVCYDANFPEHAADAAADGVEAYLCSGAFFPGGERRCELHMAARALDNGIYVAFAGLVGAPSSFIGGTAIYDPFGTAVARVEGGEGLAIAALDPDLIAQARAGQRMWAERRADLGVRSVRRADVKLARPGTESLP
ncbi:carbon-nitrogen hydrolase family protein [Nocardioides sp.]|uniref:carbon-nitrogen hydrolase family protein n=1 Tax=Nocardioides sp. TaxID=35761 RepID=UPI0026095B07|nr:carbon-nitrogen hydrolase family protein [Nocardioides sp.]